MEKQEIKNKLFSRLDKYCRIHTTSDPRSETYPSSKNQKDLARVLDKELKEIGMKNVSTDKYCYVTAFLPGNVKTKKTIAFLAHMDVSPAACGKGVKPKIHKNYKGGPIDINSKKGIILTPTNCPPLKEHIGDDIVTASGDTLLGADNKAGISIIMTAMEYLIKNPNLPRPNIKIAFTPDEEIGRGTEKFDVKKFAADAGYTFDGDLKGAVEAENFNADFVEINIKGKSVHPGTAKNAMANAARIAAEICSSWPENMTPENTDGYDGFIMFDEIKGNIENASLSGIIREHDIKKLKKMEKLLLKIIEEKKQKYPLSQININIKEQYRNMKSVIDKNPQVLSKLIKAVKKSGIEPVIKPIRGGTDGARLSFMGLPCPNVFTGGYNYHGPYEWISLDSMYLSYKTLINICEEWTN
ncbi:MAG: peptidase T [Elusimicrobia bacterium]|nr:peptidase T [Elusimicrobiota bacterium]